MDSTFVWILLFGGAAVMGVLLVTSERELKVKRREIEALLAKLDNSAGGAVAPTVPSEAQKTELADLRAQNGELQAELAAVTSDLTQSQNIIADLRDAQQSSASNQQLSADNDRLSREVNELRSRLMASEAQVQSSLAQSHDEQAGGTRMQAEIDHLRAALAESQEKVRDLESVRQNLPDVNAIAAAHNQERDALQQRITELERRVSMDQERMAELQTMRDHLTQAQSAQDALREEIRRHEAEIPGWQAHIAAGEESRRKLAELQAPLNQLLSQQAVLADQQRRLQEDLVSFSRQIAAATDGSEHSNTSMHAGPDNDRGANASAQAVAANLSSETSASVGPATTGGRRYGILAVLLFVVGAVVLGSQLFVADPEVPNNAANARPVQSARTEPARERAAKTTSQQAADEIQSTRGPVRQAAQTRPATREISTAVITDNPPAKIQPASLGTYQIVRPSRVYAAPSELSSYIAEIEPGVRVTVVQARDGWLEIHSRHGRPPGFIRREAATRISGQH